MKNILFIASEAVPFIKTGGLADVVGSLPKCFDKKYFDVRVMIPKYLCIKEVLRNEMTYIDHFYMDYLGQSRYVGILQYAALAESGYFPVEDLKHTKEIGSYLQGHPDVQKTPGIEAGTGSLGQGLSIGLGMALGLKLDRLDSRTYVLVGDGEIAEGQIWEAAMAASAFKADNLVAIVDRNRLQANGRTKERFDTGDIMAKFLSFGWHVIEINGHDMREILSALDEAETVKGVPTAIIANTVKGKGVSFAENVVGYHNGMLTEETYRQALLELTVQEQEA